MSIRARPCFQDARTVATKRGKSITTWFFPVGELPLRIVTEWICHLRGAMLWGNDDPLFPNQGRYRQYGSFQALGLELGAGAAHLRSARYSGCLHSGGLSYFNPHSFRNTLAQLGERRCATRRSSSPGART